MYKLQHSNKKDGTGKCYEEAELLVEVVHKCGA